MGWYSDFPARRSRQIVADLVAVLVIAAAVVTGVVLHHAIAAFADVGVQLEQAGAGFRDTMADVGEDLGGVPLIGGGIRAPFDAASGAGGMLADAGQAQQDVVLRLALVAGLLVAAGPVLAVLAVWLVPRLVFVRRSREARALARSADGPELLALRALATRPIAALTAVDPHPLEAWRRGDAGAIRGLAQLELRRAGIRLE